MGTGRATQADLGLGVLSGGDCGPTPGPDRRSTAFPDGRTAILVRVDKESDVAAIGAALGLPDARPTIALIGGAGGLSQSDVTHLQPFFHDALVPLAAELHAYVVDGGTDAGVMRLMGLARHDAGADFPLIGVAAAGTVSLPDDAPRPTAATLESHHSHFVLVPGSSWGEEAPWLARVAGALAREQPSVTVLVNGGDVALRDVTHSVAAARPVFVVTGSGRIADTLAAAIQGSSATDPVRDLIATGLLRASDPAVDARALRRTLGSMLATGG